jgi:hypothetical protein
MSRSIIDKIEEVSEMNAQESLYTEKTPGALAKGTLSYEQIDEGGFEPETTFLKGGGRFHLKIMASHRHIHQQLFHNKSLKEKTK